MTEKPIRIQRKRTEKKVVAVIAVGGDYLNRCLHNPDDLGRIPKQNVANYHGLVNESELSE